MIQIPNLPHFGLSHIKQFTPVVPHAAPNQPIEMKEATLQRCHNYIADTSGCGYWRMLWPEQLLNGYQRLNVSSNSTMILDLKYYENLQTVKIQRQAAPHQLQFIRFLKEHTKCKLIYEIDDIIFHEDIPEYNKFKIAFADPEIKKAAIEIMNMCDEISVTCDFMKDYYKSKTGNPNVTVIPNYPPKFWMGRFYNEQKIYTNFSKNKKKPRVLYPGSGAHFDVDNRVKQRDDFEHVLNAVRSTVNQFQWVFLGAYPLSLQDLVKSGKIEFHPWKPIYDYPEQIDNLNVQAMVAPLQDNTFNKAKSDLKYIEACCYGIPIVCQDLCTYSNAPYRFKTGDEMIDQLKKVLNYSTDYMNISRSARKYAETRFLENDENLSKHFELYTTPFGSPLRKYLK